MSPHTAASPREDHTEPTNAPVLCLAFNRPDLFKDLLGAIRKGGGRELFIAIDGPRAGHSGDLALCEQVRALAEGVDWATRVEIKVQERNLGVRDAVESAVSWALGHSSAIIILEDDCMPDPSFFRFCDELLVRYRDDGRVMQIAGTNWGAAPTRFDRCSYAFTSFAPIWGWATWRRAWDLYDRKFESWPQVKASGLARDLPVSRRFRRLLEPEWDRVGIDGGEWDRKWQYSILRHHGLSACPQRNLVMNVGFREDGTHLTGVDRVFSELPLERISAPLVHPPEVARNAGVESVFERIYWQKLGWPAQALNRLAPNPRVNSFVRTIGRKLLPRPS
jgi:hypothetical protein